MGFDLKWSPDARDHLSRLSAHHRTTVVDGAEKHLQDEPGAPAKKRKLLRENPLATWELRLGDLRVFYNIDEPNRDVEIVAVGIKAGNRLIIGGEEIEL